MSGIAALAPKEADVALLRQMDSLDGEVYTFLLGFVTGFGTCTTVVALLVALWVMIMPIDDDRKF